jgi:putative aminopeptidase FrvX
VANPTLKLVKSLTPSEIFMEVARVRTPWGSEASFFHEELTRRGFRRDLAGNYFLTIGESGTLFTAHLDTVGEYGETMVDIYKGLAYAPTGILGADDRAGVALILWMIERGKPGQYALFLGEERGCIGSEYAATHWDTRGIRAVVSLDRRGQESIITHQMGQRSASDEYAWALAERLAAHGIDMAPDNTGSYSDSAAFTDVVGECTNLSVGYSAAHTSAETQNLAFLDALAEGLLAVDFDTLPIVRRPGEVEYLLEEWPWYQAEALKGGEDYDEGSSS